MNAARTIVLNWRMRLTGGLPESRADFERIAGEGGIDDDELAAAIPPSEISIEAMREADTYNSGAAMKSWGLEPHQRTPDMPAFRVFLDKRFGHSTDDIPRILTHWTRRPGMSRSKRVPAPPMGLTR